MPYFNCPNCRLSISSLAAYAVERYCPRCTSERGEGVGMVVSALPQHMLIDGLRVKKPTTGAAEGSR
jgi:hypothetical protein